MTTPRFRPVKPKLTRIHHHNGIRYGFDIRLGWFLHYTPDNPAFPSGWLPCVPSHIQTK